MRKKPKTNIPRLRNELIRQAFHLSLGLFLSGVLFSTNLFFFRTFLMGVLITGGILSYIAMTKKWSTLNRLLSKVERPTEMVPGQSAFMFVLGVLIPTFLFSDPLAVFLSVVALTLQDAFSALIGMRFGRIKILPHKTIEGSLAGFGVCWLGLALIVPIYPAALLALSATVVELLPFDDSLSIPVFVAYLAHAFV